MRPVPTRRRLLSALTLLLHLAVAGWVPLADAWLQTGVPEQAAVHEPGQHDSRCPPVHHHHHYCQLCRVLNAGSAAASPPYVPTADVLLPAVPLLDGPVRPTCAPASALGARAPPLA